MRLIVCLVLLLTACAAPAPPPPPSPTPAPAPKPAASPAPSPSPSPSPQPAGRIPTADPAVHVFLWGNPDSTQRDLTLAKDGGFRWVKQRFEWRNIEGRGK